jgi:hypothetical protein
LIACGSCRAREQRTIAGRRQEIQTKLVVLTPDRLRELDEAEQVLDDFSVFSRDQSDPEVKRHMLQLGFERVWLDEDRVVAVRPKHAVVPSFFQSARPKARCKRRERRGSIPEFTPHDIDIR